LRGTVLVIDEYSTEATCQRSSREFNNLLGASSAWRVFQSSEQQPDNPNRGAARVWDFTAGRTRRSPGPSPKAEKLVASAGPPPNVRRGKQLSANFHAALYGCATGHAKDFTRPGSLPGTRWDPVSSRAEAGPERDRFIRSRRIQGHCLKGDEVHAFASGRNFTLDRERKTGPKEHYPTLFERLRAIQSEVRV